MNKIKYLNEGFDFNQAQFHDDEIDILEHIIQEDIDKVIEIINPKIFNITDCNNTTGILSKNVEHNKSEIFRFTIEIGKDTHLKITFPDLPYFLENLLYIVSNLTENIANNVFNHIKHIDIIYQYRNANNKFYIVFTPFNKSMGTNLYKHSSFIIENRDTPITYFFDNILIWDDTIENKDFDIFKWLFGSYDKDNYTNIIIDGEYSPHFGDACYQVKNLNLYSILFESFNSQNVHYLNEGFDFNLAQIQDDEIDVLDAIIQTDMNKVIEVINSDVFQVMEGYANNKLYCKRVKSLKNLFYFIFNVNIYNRHLEINLPYASMYFNELITIVNKLCNQIENGKFNYIKYIDIILEAPSRRIFHITFHNHPELSPTLYKYSSFIIDNTYKTMFYDISHMYIVQKQILQQDTKFFEFLKWLFSAYDKETYQNIILEAGTCSPDHAYSRILKSIDLYSILFENM